MNKKTIIRKAIGLTEIGYHNQINGMFHTWCEKTAAENALPVRLLTLDSALYQWYLDMWAQMVESRFYADYEEFLHAELEEPVRMFELFWAYADAVEEFWPTMIMKRLKKQFKKHTTNA